ncbi:MAG: hypothetical protein PUE66_07755 [Erysipelotrichaceae bacterium]|nr:hypothetical protein [Erysipelotrichaceae bacterium]
MKNNNILNTIKKMYQSNNYLHNDNLNLIDIINNDLKNGYLIVYVNYKTIIFDDNDIRIEYHY